MEIGLETVAADLEKVYGKKVTNVKILDEAAKSLISVLKVLNNNLTTPEHVKKIYSENPLAEKRLPISVYKIATKYANREIDFLKANHELAHAEQQYLQAFADIGVRLW